jgi:hypothetical protein
LHYSLIKITYVTSKSNLKKYHAKEENFVKSQQERPEIRIIQRNETSLKIKNLSVTYLRIEMIDWVLLFLKNVKLANLSNYLFQVWKMQGDTGSLQDLKRYHLEHHNVPKTIYEEENPPGISENANGKVQGSLLSGIDNKNVRRWRIE